VIHLLIIIIPDILNLKINIHLKVLRCFYDDINALVLFSLLYSIAVFRKLSIGGHALKMLLLRIFSYFSDSQPRTLWQIGPCLTCELAWISNEIPIDWYIFLMIRSINWPDFSEQNKIKEIH
jgi:hypothetical protein